MAQAAADGAELVVAVGGDGTLNEVANGLLALPGERPELAVIPFGTGMDFARSHGIPRKLEAALDVAREGRTTTIDAGRVSYQAWDGSAAEALLRQHRQRRDERRRGAPGQPDVQGARRKMSFFTALVRVFAGWK